MTDILIVLFAAVSLLSAACGTTPDCDTVVFAATRDEAACPADTAEVGGDYYFPVEVEGDAYFLACEEGHARGPICKCPHESLVVMDLYVPVEGAHYVDDGDGFCEVAVDADQNVYCFM